MLRLLFLAALAAAPLVANAHGGHHTKAAAAEEMVVVRDAISASAPCAPGGGGEVCSCHGLSCLSHFDPTPVAQAPVRGSASQPAQCPVAEPITGTLPPAPFVRFSPRGPPLFS